MEREYATLLLALDGCPDRRAAPPGRQDLGQLSEAAIDLKRTLLAGARLLFAWIVYLIAFAVSYGLVMPAVPPDPAAAASPIPPAVAPLLMAALHTAVMGWLILRSRLTGWRLAGTMTAVFFAVQSVMPQVESWIFQYSGMAAHLPATMIPYIVMAGLLHACLWIPLAVRILGRGRGEAPSRPEPPLTAALRGWKLPAAAAAYVVVYFVFGHFIAWRSPAVRAYYGGAEWGSFWVQMHTVLRDAPWLFPAQVVRGAVWAVIGVIVLRSMRGSALEKALALGALFSVVMNAGLLLANPYMPYEVRIVHLLETGSSNFLFGVCVAWMFRE